MEGRKKSFVLFFLSDGTLPIFFANFWKKNSRAHAQANVSNAHVLYIVRRGEEDFIILQISLSCLIDSAAAALLASVGGVVRLLCV